MKKQTMKMVSALLAALLIMQTLPMEIFANEIEAEIPEALMMNVEKEAVDLSQELILKEENLEMIAKENIEQKEMLPAEENIKEAAPVEMEKIVIEKKEAIETEKMEEAPADQIKEAVSEVTAEVQNEAVETVAVPEETKVTETQVQKPAVQTYQITWLNDDGSVLAVTEVEKGTMPVFDGTPVKEADVHYTYEFSGWNPTIRSATSNKTYTAKFNKKAIQYRVTVNFNNIMKPDGTIISSSESNNLGAGTSWSFTQKKLDNKITTKSFTYNGTKYTYTNQWILEDGTVFTGTYRINGNDLTSDLVINLSPVYEKVEPWHLNFRYIDNISTGSGSWANQGAASGYSHTFKTPDAQPHYMFINWEDAATGITYINSDKYVFPAEYMVNGLTTNVNIYANWQPSATVQYYSADGSMLLNEVEAFEDVAVNSWTPENDGFIGWFDAPLAADIKDEDAREELNAVLGNDEICALPSATTERVERTVRKVYARFITDYTVEHYIEELDGSFTVKDTESFTGIADTEAAANAKEYEGFTFDSSAEGTAVSGIIAGDGSLTLRLYYTRNSYKVSYKFEGDIPGNAGGLPETAEYKFGADVKIAEDAKAEGFKFSGWNKEEFTMPAEDVVITGSFTAIEVEPEKAEEVPAAPEVIPAAPVVRPAATVSEPEIIETVETVEAEIIEDVVPMAQLDVETVEDEAMPTAAKKVWALVNLISTILTAIISLLMAITFFSANKEEDEESEDEDNKKWSKFFGFIPAAVAIITFIITENMKNSMVMTDKWTPFMIIVLLINAVLAYLTRNDKEENDEDKEVECA
ncbi:MAG: hypothetical protein IKG47_02290 [Oscillospiraceae bacterium]|nr:hypothetical protein [Oscillospiraceae bacterium]